MSEFDVVLVYLRDRAVFGEVVRELAHGALIKYEIDGKIETELFDRDDYIIWRRILFTYEEEGFTEEEDVD